MLRKRTTGMLARPGHWQVWHGQGIVSPGVDGCIEFDITSSSAVLVGPRLPQAGAASLGGTGTGSAATGTAAVATTGAELEARCQWQAGRLREPVSEPPEYESPRCQCQPLAAAPPSQAITESTHSLTASGYELGVHRLIMSTATGSPAAAARFIHMMDFSPSQGTCTGSPALLTLVPYQI